jgi:hypothetical protein
LVNWFEVSTWRVIKEKQVSTENETPEILTLEDNLTIHPQLKNMF